MRVLFRTKIFYHSTSIFAIVPSVPLDARNYIENDSKIKTKSEIEIIISFNCIYCISSSRRVLYPLFNLLCCIFLHIPLDIEHIFSSIPKYSFKIPLSTISNALSMFSPLRTI